MPTRLVVACLSTTVVAACQTDQQSVLDPSYGVRANVQNLISGSITGPDGANICGQLPAFSYVRIEAVPMPGTTSYNYTYIACPANAYSMVVDSGDYRILADVSWSGSALPGLIPLQWLEPGVVSVDGTTDMQKDVAVQEGQAIGGMATLDGSPYAGLGLTLSHVGSLSGEGTIGISGAGGTWEDYGRVMLPLQLNERFLPSCSWDALAGSLVRIIPALEFAFPAGSSSVVCELETSLAAQYTNSAANMVATAFPGDIGGLSGALVGNLGLGWGVQGPLDGAPAHVPVNATQLFRGGLIISGRQHVLTGFDAVGEMACSSCQDLGLTGSVRIDPANGGGHVIEWVYDDAGSPEALGLTIVQQSYDNTGMADYILYRYAISNSSSETHTIMVGFFGDWDIDQEYSNDVGRSDPDRHLVYITNARDSGTHAGTVVIGAPPAGHYFTPFGLTEDKLLGVMRGTTRNQGTTDPSDTRYYQTVGPVRLGPGESRVIWLGVILAADKTRFLANADAALADIRIRSAVPAPVLTSAQTIYERVPVPSTGVFSRTKPAKN